MAEKEYKVNEGLVVSIDPAKLEEFREKFLDAIIKVAEECGGTVGGWLDLPEYEEAKDGKA